MRRSLVALLLVSGCVGSVGGDDPGQSGTTDPATGEVRGGGTPTSPGPGSSSSSTPTGPAGTALPPPTSVGATPLRRLTRVEYANTVRDLLGATSNVAAAFSSDTLGVAGFTVGGAVTPVEANQYQEAAEQLAGDAVKNLKALLPCAGTTPVDEATCSDRFVTTFGKRAYRRPLVADEVTELKTLYTALRQDGYDFANAIRIVMEAMLESPNFLYRPELGAAGDPKSTMKPLTTFEVASRLSYFVWQSMPDDALLADAESGALAKADVLDKQVRRMMGDDRARGALAQFGTGWLRLDYGDVVKDPKVYPAFTPQVKTSMLKEAGEFVSQTVLGGGPADALFTADYTFADSTLAKIYGVTAPTAAGMPRLTLDPAQGRSGLLTQVAFLTKFAGPSATSPTRRGVMVREQFLCQDIPPPPPDLNPTPPAASPTLSVRDQVTQHMKDPSCAGCHRLLDPIGLSLEAFDGSGKYRTTDAGKPIDASGELTGTDVDGTVTGARDLGQRLGRSPGAKRCVATQMFRFALGRMEDKDGAALDRIVAAFAAGKYDGRELMAALAKSEAFLYRPAN